MYFYVFELLAALESRWIADGKSSADAAQLKNEGDKFAYY